MPPKSLSKDVKNDDCKDEASIVLAPKVSDRTKPIPGKVPLVTYPYEFDEVMLIWRRSRQHPLEVETF